MEKNDVAKKAGSIQTTKEKSHAGTVISSSTVEQPVLSNEIKHPPLAQISFSASRTINTGNYESYRMAISCTLPCQISEIDETFEITKSFVDSKLSEVLMEAEASLKGDSDGEI